ncbi:GGDEF domain-containing protein [Chitinilyticum litopenaei]|uniref:GGDEF domain-containing protein n=1 Tax=Chitinilyticum litopenaei TaxID=1121276 RepID=UPI00068451D6|nr:GGDEF domain-containing protein [Chitinilyticum litopenaei]
MPIPAVQRHAQTAPASQAVPVLVLLIAITLGGLFAYDTLLIKTLRIDPAAGFPAKSIDDRGEGGKTTSTLRTSKDAHILECEVSKSYQWPYCEIAIDLRRDGEGINLEGFERISIKLDYEAPADKTVRVYLRNFNPAYTPGAPDRAYKVNQIEYNPRQYPQGLGVSLRYFQVATWWLNDNRIPLELSQPQFDNVTRIEIATGATVTESKIRMVLHSIELEGYWLARSTFYALLIGLWVGAALLFLLLRLWRSWRVAQQMQELTASLSAESEVYRNLARTDALTGALNRTGAVDVLFRQSQLASEQEQALSMIYLDLDHFKPVNDRHGHAVGDAVLSELVQLLRGHVRDSDSVIRWGGEEFLLLLPGTRLAQAAHLADKLRLAIACHQWPEQLSLTCSFGVAELGDEKVQQCIERADAALYAAKRNGRNRVELAARPG